MPERPSEPDASAAADQPATNVGGALRERPSKTRRKQESHDLQSLGEALLDLPDDHLATLGLGAVKAERDNAKIDVLFADGMHVLVHGR